VYDSKNVYPSSVSNNTMAMSDTRNVYDSKNVYPSSVSNNTMAMSDTRNGSNVLAPTVMPVGLYETRTNIINTREVSTKTPTVTRPSVQDVNINISGRITLDAGNGQMANIDMAKLFNNHEFVNLLRQKVAEGMLRGVSATGTEDKNSTQSIMGGAYTPNNSYARLT
jgi:hypothetical protein